MRATCSLTISFEPCSGVCSKLPRGIPPSDECFSLQVQLIEAHRERLEAWGWSFVKPSPTCPQPLLLTVPVLEMIQLGVPCSCGPAALGNPSSPGVCMGRVRR